ncbi:dihydrofolate reductase family protein [Nonomuraea wenchangensis]|uniref:dihydrofolate reductase family protein n=1 Tax=Nonomuraea wenchangensis TaxID=568860 RepID=UPI00331B0B6E
MVERSISRVKGPPPGARGRARGRRPHLCDGWDRKAPCGKAREVAGGKNVAVMGGADLGRQFMRAGLVDQIGIHLVPVLFGGGQRLFDRGVRPDAGL